MTILERKETPKERIERIYKEFDEMLRGKQTTTKTIIETPNKLTRFGLTLREAKGWMKKEPNYISSDGISQKKPSDEDFTKPTLTLFKLFKRGL